MPGTRKVFAGHKDTVWHVAVSPTERYALSGSVHDARGMPIAFATIEAVFLDQRFTTRSGEDGRFQLSGRRKSCEEQVDVVSVSVTADAFRSKRRVLRFDEVNLDIVLDRADF